MSLTILCKIDTNKRYHPGIEGMMRELPRGRLDLFHARQWEHCDATEYTLQWEIYHGGLESGPPSATAAAILAECCDVARSALPDATVVGSALTLDFCDWVRRTDSATT